MNHLAKTFILTFIILICGITILRSQATNDIALILKSSGTVKVKKESAGNWRVAEKGLRLNSGDLIKTAENSLAAIIFTDDKSLLKVRDNSMLAIRGKRTEASVSKRLVCSLGQFWLKVSQQKSKLVVETPTGVAAVKGTEFYGVVDSEGNTTIVVIEGMVQLINKLGEALVKAGQSGKLTKNGAPQVFPTGPDGRYSWATEGDGDHELLFEFQDSNGNKKNLKIIYH
ncbi:MAG: FecR family protein [candidate division KSB1 bacterium]|nr:FecR family protein [candidate division KSB1 bacterium]MDZ7318230.1 FecR family protein [candidate division KSB1 bacterium]MDZ7341176.1 FecR family protein [candidate division KSB1 bacterium]